MRVASLPLALRCALPAAAAEDYLIVFSSDSTPYKANKTHTFAALVRVEKAPGQPPCVASLESISWLPATMKVRALAVRPETGRNVPLDETLRVFLSSGHRVCMWGPYRVGPELAEAFRARIATLESSFQYKGACLFSPLDVCDCARAVEEMVEPHRRYIGVFGYGAAAASFIVRKFSPWLIEPEQPHPWVGTLIGLDEFPLVRRPFGDYTSWWNQLGTWARRK
jgi:hypothetical protein